MNKQPYLGRMNNMSFQRKIERNQLKKQWKDHNKGVAKRYRSEFRGFWKWFQKKKRGEK